MARPRSAILPRCPNPVLVAACLLALLGAPGAASAQAVVSPTEQLSFNRPEAWALKYFTSATLLTGLETPRTAEPGSIAIGLELGWLPALSQAQRRVGFNGTKVEDLDKSPLFLRPRVTIALPGRLSVAAAADPPLRTFGIKPKIFALAIGRVLHDARSWSLGVRGYAQAGSVEGAFTCPISVLSFAPGSPSNSYGCQAESSDTATLRFAGGELSGAYRPSRLHGISPHAAVAVNFFDGAFQVNARTFGYLDHTRLLTHGVTLSSSAGATLPLTARFAASVDVLFVPLSVRRREGAAVTDDPFVNVRALVAYRLR